jgi:hypothetical protein
MNAKRFASIMFATGILAGAGSPLRAEDDENVKMLANSLPQATVSLAQGLKASEPQGKPISGKFEIEGGALQLSVYTAKDGKFTEVVVDHQSGAIRKAESITDGDDLKEATAQSQTLAKAKMPLEKAVQAVVTANPGYRAVSVIPTNKSGGPTAEVTLVKGEHVKKVSKKLE